MLAHVYNADLMSIYLNVGVMVSIYDAGPSTPKRKRNYRNELEKDEKQWRKQAFAESWLNLPEFRGWLATYNEDKCKAKCKACNKVLVAGKSELLKHAETTTHKKKVIEKKSNMDIALFFDERIDDKIITAELRYALLLVEHNLSFRAIEGIIDVTKSIYGDSKIPIYIKMKRQKCTNIINHVLAKHIRITCDNEMNNNIFSVLVDESTDLGNNKNLCILVKYYKNGKSIVHFLDLVKLLADGNNAANMYKSFKNCLKDHNLNVKNIVGYCSDNANVMMGKNESFQQYLIKENANVFILGCICHSCHLIASHAADELPKNIETLMHSLYSYFSRSPKRQSILEGIQEIMKKEKHKLINPSRTRWLSLRNSVDRVLEQWHVLQETFLLASVEDKNPMADLLLRELNNPFTKAYIEFMKYVLPYFYNFNTLFQSEKPLVAYLNNESKRFLRLLCSNFVKPDILNEGAIENINVNNPHIFLSLENIIIGPAATNTLLSLADNHKNEINEYRIRCLRFYRVAVEQILKRLPLRDKFIKELEFLLPSVALNNSPNRPSLNHICEKYKTILDNVICVIEEWNRLPFYFSDAEIADIVNLNIEGFWEKIGHTQNFNDQSEFANLFQLAKIALSLPHANADVERVFSMCTNIKTKTRNRLSTQTLSSILRIKMDMKYQNANARTYSLGQEIYKIYNSSYYRNENDGPSSNIGREDTSGSDSD